MASLSSHNGQRRKRRQQLARSNSSLLGTLKNIVTAPLKSWFATTEEFDDSEDSKGKRRRLTAALTESNLEENVREARIKRMRMHSPPMHQHDVEGQIQSSLHPPVSGGYLDPPSFVFQQHVGQTNSRLGTSAARSASVSLPSSTLQNVPQHKQNTRSTLSPMRNLSISRTMSMDPPAHTHFHDFHNGITESSTTFLPHSSISRNISMPPVSLLGRPSFRMRTSITPQPQREISEPPTLNVLRSNPTFVRGPTPLSELRPEQSSHFQSTTLGSLVDSARNNRSPSRNRSSLLFGSAANESKISTLQNPAEKALHELDIYRTPLLPTRLRSSKTSPSSSNIIATSTIPDMFKSRQNTKLILMQDDKRADRLGRKVSGGKPMVNETKPYAGEGGMRKLLARRKQEEAEIEDEENYNDGGVAKEMEKVAVDEDDAMDGGTQSTLPATISQSPKKPATNHSSPPDWFARGHRSSSGSSLRIGRTKSSRNHISRPLRPAKKFSAAFEDDGDDAIEEAEQETREKDREALQQAADNAPVFKIPTGFTFANTSKQIEHNNADAKEPPISTLPFSLSKLTTAVTPAETTSTLSEIFSKGETPLKESHPVTLTQSSLPKVEASIQTTLVPTAKSDGNIPNFFASSIFGKEIEVPKPAPLAFAPSTSSAAPVQGFSFTPMPSASLNDAENPFWEAEKKKDRSELSETKATSGMFSTTGHGSDTPSTGTSLSDGAYSTTSSAFTPIVPHAESQVGITISAFGQAASSTDSAKSSFTFGSGSNQTSQRDATTSTVNVFGGGDLSKFNMSSTSFRSETAKPSALFSADRKESANLLGVDIQRHSVSTAPFMSNQPFSKPIGLAQDMPKSFFVSPPTQASKPIFGGGNLSLGQISSANQETERKTPTPFSFEISGKAAKEMPAFGFDVPASSSSSSHATVGFQFGGSGNTATDVSAKPFAFSVPTIAAPVDSPVTPPKNPDLEFRMDESPTREGQSIADANKPPELRPTLGFAFGTSAPPIFDSANSNTSSPFAFGSSAPAPAPTPFTTVPEPKNESTPFSFGLAPITPTTSSPFTFGQSKPTDAADSPRPSTTGSFSFSTTPVSAPGPGPSFSFGAPSNPANNLFSQQQSGSAPSSPSTFQPSPFSFGQTTSSTTSSFGFGSQPASPLASSTNVTLPPSVGGFGQTTPSSPFGAPAPLASATSTGGVPLFTIGAPPSSAPGAPRQIKKLPTRRGAVKR